MDLNEAYLKAKYNSEYKGSLFDRFMDKVEDFAAKNPMAGSIMANTITPVIGSLGIGVAGFNAFAYITQTQSVGTGLIGSSFLAGVATLGGVATTIFASRSAKHGVEKAYRGFKDKIEICDQIDSALDTAENTDRFNHVDKDNNVWVKRIAPLVLTMCFIT